MAYTMKYETALNAASRIAHRQGKITREQFKAIQDCLADKSPGCACEDCEAVSISAAMDNGQLTAEQAANPKAINWQGLLAFIQALLPIILAIIGGLTPPAPPAPTVPAGNGG